MLIADIAGWSLGVAVVALAASLTALALTLWERFLARAEIWPLAVNTGHRKGVVTGLAETRRFPDIKQWTQARIVQALPLVLEPDAASPAFYVNLVPSGPTAVRNALTGDEDPKLEIVVRSIRRTRPENAGIESAGTESRTPMPLSPPETSGTPEPASGETPTQEDAE